MTFSRLLTCTEKPWWTDLQEKREQFKAAKIRAQSLSFNNGKIINMKQRPIDTSEPAVIDYESEPVTEYPRPMTTPLPFNNLPSEDWPTGKYPILRNFVIEGVACQLPSSLRRLQVTPLLQTSLIPFPVSTLT